MLVPLVEASVLPTAAFQAGLAELLKAYDYAHQIRRAAWDFAVEIAQLRAAGMTLDHLVKVTTFLSDRKYALENREVRLRRLGGRQTALTVIVTGIFDEAWLVEIEAVAAA